MTENIQNPVPESKTISLINQLLSYKGLIIGIAAVITAIASWFKPTDVTATKATYEVLSIRVNALAKTTEDLSKSIEDSHDEVTNLRAYIEGFNNGKLARLSGNSQSITLPPVAKVTKPKVNVKIDADGIPPEPVWIPNLTPALKPAQPKAAAPSAPLPPFDQIVRGSSAASF
jgi:hypothetical protein